MSQLLRIEADDCQGTVVINSIDLDRANVWACERKDDLWSSPGLRGDNIVIQGVTGRLARPTVEDQHVVSLPMIFGGGYAYDTGQPVGAGERFAQLSTNLDYFEQQVVALQGGTDETVTATFTKPNGTVLTGPVQVVRPWQPVFLEAPFARAVLTIVIPNGRLVVA